MQPNTYLDADAAQVDTLQRLQTRPETIRLRDVYEVGCCSPSLVVGLGYLASAAS